MVDSNMYSYQYICFYGQDAGVSGSWMGPGNSGISNHQWSSTYGTFNTDSPADFTIGLTQITASDNTQMHSMIHIPIDCELVGFTGTVHKFGGNHGGIRAAVFATTGSAASLVPGAPDYGAGNTPVKLTLQAVATASNPFSQGFNQKTNHIEDLSRSTALPAGTKLWPGIFTGVDQNVGDNFRMNFTIVLRTKMGI